ncbi:signal peptide peptidase SppA [Polyangium aurulentum]|uniref:signal peptide peptidase SppA n=1 Tax=Polyangium aurulentum TaxID=2567896 RepID=UPI0010ADDBE0|nr:signal peptide peptidase SppA [Polyangium aurulentum]UQA62480.1 signal peptide peptidase SppA [Polyangium aurulentum]
MLFALLGNLLRLLFYPFHALRRALASPRGGHVVLEIDGRVVDIAPPSPGGRLRALLRRGSSKPPLSVGRVRQLARLIIEDPNVRGLVVRVQSLAAGPGVLVSLREVIRSVRLAGKDVVFYLPMGADSRIAYLASAGSRVVVGPETLVAPIGYAVEARYVRRALDRAGVEPEVFARGAYKAAAEPLVRDEMSDAQREQLGDVLGAQHEALVKALAEGRGVTKDQAARWVDEAPHNARRAVELGMVDAVAYEDELDAHLGAPPGRRAPLMSADRYIAVRQPFAFRPVLPRSVVGVIEVHGPIVSRSRFSLGPLASEDRIIAAIRAARASRRVGAVVLHIDSPGGSAVASDRIHHEVERLAEVKPVVAYLSNVAASGGYYVAAASKVIVAQPQTITGSIGVVSAHFVVRGLLGKLGVSIDVVKRGARADLFSKSRPLDEGERAVLEGEMDEFYKTFLGVVARGRGKTIEDIEPLAGGRIYSGIEAQARGLVDVLGGLTDAIERARGLAGDPTLEPRVLRPPRGMVPPPPMPRLAHAALAALGLDGLGQRLNLGLSLGPMERVLCYSSECADAAGSGGDDAEG